MIIYKYLMDREFGKERVRFSLKSDEKVFILLSYRLICMKWNEAVIFAFEILKNKNFFRHYSPRNDIKQLLDLKLALL